MMQSSILFNTRLSKTFKLRAPIINAGMAFVAGPELAAAVANAGGLGLLGGAMVPAHGLRTMIRATRNLTEKTFGVDLIGEFIEDSHIQVLVEEKVAIAVFFWSAPSAAQVEMLRSGGVAFWMQVGTVTEARDALELGADAIIVQGSEAGGHNRSEGTLSTLFPAVRASVPNLPLIAAGGISDGASMVAALVLGADAVLCGTRFLASKEADAHDGYKQRVVEAKVGSTAITTLFGPEWPRQPLRALTNEAVRVSAGREVEALAAAQGQIIGKTVIGGQSVPVPRYSALLPTRAFDADLEWACLTAGESAANIHTIESAADIITSMMEGAVETIGMLNSKMNWLKEPVGA
jgi:NAD(P)H-dependent flavin oxidoreductase YrpB (nitropropane dioxygenase family)